MKLKHGAALVLTGFLLAGCGAHEPQEKLTVKDVVNVSSLLEDPLTEEEVNTQLSLPATASSPTSASTKG